MERISFVHRMLLTCKTASEFIEKRKNNSMTLKERVQLKIHLLICKVCRYYEKQSAIIDKLLHLKSKQQAETKHTDKEIEELKENIIQKFNP
jgi:hypothetical protein